MVPYGLPGTAQKRPDAQVKQFFEVPCRFNHISHYWLGKLFFLKGYKQSSSPFVQMHSSGSCAAKRSGPSTGSGRHASVTQSQSLLCKDTRDKPLFPFHSLVPGLPNISLPILCNISIPNTKTI